MQEYKPSPAIGARSLVTAKAIAVILAAIGVVRLLTLAAYPILDKSEARYAYIAELMIQTGNWITPFVDHGVPFWAKPILSFWLTAASYAAFGINEFAARLPSFVVFVMVSWIVFYLGSRERDQKFGLAAACVFASTSLGFYLGGTVMTDPALMLGTTLVMASFWKCITGNDAPNRTWGYLFFFGVSIGLLAKGPIGAIIPGLSIAVWITQHRKWADTWRRLPWITGTILTLVLVVPWYALAEYHTPGFLRYFIIGEHFDRFLVAHWTGDLYGAGRPRPPGTIWLFGLIAVLPWSVVMLILFFRPAARRELFQKSVINDPWLSYLLLWMLAPLVLFSFAKNILITYVAPSVPAFVLLTAHALWRTGEKRDRYRLAATAGIVPLLFLAAVIKINLDPGSRYLPSQAGIVATFKKLTAGQPSALIYAFNKPFSADFYSGGQASFVRDSDGMESALRAGYPYFVVPTDVYPRLPEDLRQQLELVAERNRSSLLRPRTGAATPR